MNILYHLSTLPPKMPRAEALSQETAALCAALNGQVIHVNPNEHLPLPIPRLLFGFHKLGTLRHLEPTIDIHHFYNPDPFPFPYLHLMRRPVIYFITCGVGSHCPAHIRTFASFAAVSVSDRRSKKRLESWGLKNVVLLPPGIDTARFTYSPLPLQSEIRLMVGSAPWTRAQFQSKGVLALLQAAQQMPDLKLIFLWRGVLHQEMTRLVQDMNVESQVTVLNKTVDVNRVLAGVHAGITLAERPGIIKSYPHSLLDTLAAGKPVLVSRAIPMSDYVREKGCGQVVQRVTPDGILDAIQLLRDTYDACQLVARRVGQQDFRQQNMIASFQAAYESILEAQKR
ncbi:MAG: glycosyltransferase [Anaerolineae bacterium]|nr:glycosyltransferase [Anaerolineae bacterium]